MTKSESHQSGSLLSIQFIVFSSTAEIVIFQFAQSSDASFGMENMRSNFPLYLYPKYCVVFLQMQAFCEAEIFGHITICIPVSCDMVKLSALAEGSGARVLNLGRLISMSLVAKIRMTRPSSSSRPSSCVPRPLLALTSASLFYGV